MNKEKLLQALLTILRLDQDDLLNLVNALMTQDVKEVNTVRWNTYAEHNKFLIYLLENFEIPYEFIPFVIKELDKHEIEKIKKEGIYEHNKTMSK